MKEEIAFSQQLSLGVNVGRNLLKKWLGIIGMISTSTLSLAMILGCLSVMMISCRSNSDTASYTFDNFFILILSLILLTEFAWHFCYFQLIIFVL